MSSEWKNGYDGLITKLDQFIRKYYKNQMIRGAMYALALILGTYLVVTLLEYFGRFSITVRTLLFWSFVLGSLYVLVRFFFIPLGHMFRLGKVISHEQAADIVGKHFPEVGDKLLNTLQLQRMHADAPEGSLLEASIGQRIQALRPVPFSSAIDLRENRRYLKFVLPPVAVIVVLLFSNASILTRPTERLIRHGQLIAEEAPFTIRVLNNDLRVAENENITVEIELSGNEIPDRVFVEYADQQFLLERNNAVSFRYTFRNVREDLPFHFQAGGFHTDTYRLEVLPAPKLAGFTIDLHYPPYLKRSDERISNTGDLSIPEGTRITWSFRTLHTDELLFRFADSTYSLSAEGDAVSFLRTVRASGNYSVHPRNAYLINPDSIVYRLDVIPDLAPVIAVQEERDSASYLQLYFTGEISDDHGFRSLYFHYQFTGESADKDGGQLHSAELPVSREFSEDQFFYNWNLAALGIGPGDRINYYFEVWDNDGVNGSKSARTPVREYAAPTEEELEEQLEQKNEDIKDKLEESLKDAQKMQKELEELQRSLMDKKELSWQDKKKLEELLKRQEELQKQVEEVQRENQQKNQQQNELKPQSEEILQKQEQLQQLMEQIMSPELQKMMEELERLMNELNKDELQKELDQMDLSAEDLEKELDRALEQFRQLEWEQKMEQTIDKLEKLAEKQDELSEQSEQKESNTEELKQQQEALNKEFDQVKEDLKKLEEMNQQLEDPNQMPDTEQQEKEIGEEMQKSSDELQKNKKSSASKSQKGAAKKMQEMAQQMEMAMQSGEQQQQQEDMEALRALLENIITLSFDQENLMGQFRTADAKDPAYNKLGQQQRKLKDDARMVEDSLFALSKRVPQISAAVNHEINMVNEHMGIALSGVPDRKTAEITTSQQYVMTSFNNLALMLDEALKQMQQQSSCNKPGQGNCEKPGGSGAKPSAGDIKKMQEALSKQLKEMQEKGKNKGDSKGQDGQMSKQLAEMAARQAAIRKLMEEKAAEMNEDGSGNGNEMKQIAKDMEQLQKDIVNNQVTEESLRRQQDILTRLLKAENAERVREQDNERKSNEAGESPVSNPMKYAEYMRRKEQETELLRTVPANLKPYYRDKVNAYFNRLGQ